MLAQDQPKLHGMTTVFKNYVPNGINAIWLVVLKIEKVVHEMITPQYSSKKEFR